MVQRVTVLRDGLSAGTFPPKSSDRSKIIALITGNAATFGVAKPRASALGCPGAASDWPQPSPASSTISRSPCGTAKWWYSRDWSAPGRTELLETLFGLRRAERGEIRLDGKAIAPRTPREAITAGLALIPEDRRGQGISVVMPVLREHRAADPRAVRLALRTLACGREIAHAEELISRLNIRTPDPRTPAGALSGGNQQKVVLAKWLSTDATMLLFDEPTQGVDVGAKDEIYGLIDRLAAQGRAILIVSSDLEEVLAVGDRVLAMRAGRIVAEFDRLTISASRIVEAITHGQRP